MSTNNPLQLTEAQTTVLTQLIVGVARELFRAAPAPVTPALTDDRSPVPGPSYTRRLPAPLPPGHYIAADGSLAVMSGYPVETLRGQDAVNAARQAPVNPQAMTQRAHGLVQISPENFAVIVRDPAGLGYALDHDRYIREVIEGVMPADAYCTPSRRHTLLTAAPRLTLNEIAQHFANLTYEQVADKAHHINWPATVQLQAMERESLRLRF
jgi:hypothetical protein